MVKKAASAKKPTKRATKPRATFGQVLEITKKFSLKQELKQIETFLATPNGQKLWDIMTALRGPDSHPKGLIERDNLKGASTAIVRCAAFGSSVSRGWAWLDNDSHTRVRIDSDAAAIGDKAPEHFRLHIKNAFSALGLKWGENNYKGERENKA